MTERVTRSYEQAKETTEAGEGISEFAGAVVEELKDGFQLSDLGPILASAVEDLIPGFVGADLIADERKFDTSAFTRAAANLGVDLLNIIADFGDRQEARKSLAAARGD